MPLYNSKLVLAKDIISQAQELAAVEEARLTLDALGTSFYNMAINEIFNVLGYIDIEALTRYMTVTNATFSGKYTTISLLTGNEPEFGAAPLTVGRCYRINQYVSGDSFIEVGAPENKSGVEFVAIGTSPTTWISSILQVLPLYNYDKILNIEVTNNTSGNKVGLQSFGMPLAEFLKHKSKYNSGIPSGATHPYSNSVVYAITENEINILMGEDITITSPTFKLWYTRQPNLLSSINYNFTYVDLPDKYMSLLANRIAAYAEMRQGISDKSMTVVKQAYDQMLMPIDSQLRSKIMDSFQFKPTFTPNEQSTQNYINR